jgi:hypothetical protein
MAISILQGKTYDIQNGLSTETLTYFSVGKILSPQRVDRSVGWSDFDNNPSYTVTQAFLVRKAVLNEETWTSESQEVTIMPTSFIERIVENIDLERYPVIIEGPCYTDFNDLTENRSWYIEDIIERPVRIDKSLMWKDPGMEKPEFLTVSCAICLPAYYEDGWKVDSESSTSIVPLFLISHVYEWTQTSYTVDPSTVSNLIIVKGPKGDKGDSGEKGTTGSIGSVGAPGTSGSVGSTGATGATGEKGPQGLVGATGSRGPQGFMGPQGNIGTIDKNYDFFYQSTSPSGSGTSSILPGSTWYNTSTTQTYVYIFDSVNYYWLAINVQGPVGTQGPAGSNEPLKKTTEEILAITSLYSGMTIYNITLNVMCYYDGSTWKVLNNTDMI